MKRASVAKRYPKHASKSGKLRIATVSKDLALLESLVKSVAIFLVSQGVARRRISGAIARAIRNAASRARDAANLETLYVEISKLLHAWYQEPEYLDHLGRPIPLRTTGSKQSIQSLADTAGIRRQARELVRSLKSQGLIRRTSDGSYAPTTSVATLRATGPEITGYLGQSILQLLSTLQSNRQGGKAGPMLERAAIVQDLPVDQVPEFRHFSTEQGTSFVSSTNEWLEARRKVKSPARKKDVVTAGVHVFAFVRPAPARRTPRRKKT